METGGPRILVLCTGNSCRSQMAEAYLRHFSHGLTIKSAGIRADGLNKHMIKVMLEDGIDVGQQTSNTLNDYKDTDFDYVITVCDHAKESCPLFPSQTKVVHQNFTDPAHVSGTEEEILQTFRNVRSEIKNFCKKFILEFYPHYQAEG